MRMVHLSIWIGLTAPDKHRLTRIDAPARRHWGLPHLRRAADTAAMRELSP
jgi:hypothetical protein